MTKKLETAHRQLEYIFHSTPAHTAVKAFVCIAINSAYKVLRQSESAAKRERGKQKPKGGVR